MRLMGQDKNEKDRAQDVIDYDGKLWSMLDDAYCIGASAMSEARRLTDDKKSKGVLGWMHIAEKAIGEIVRLSPLIKPSDKSDSRGKTVGWDFDPEKEAEFLKTIADA
jgi:hypothetical protein